MPPDLLVVIQPETERVRAVTFNDLVEDLGWTPDGPAPCDCGGAGHELTCWMGPVWTRERDRAPSPSTTA